MPEGSAEVVQLHLPQHTDEVDAKYQNLYERHEADEVVVPMFALTEILQSEIDDVRASKIPNKNKELDHRNALKESTIAIITDEKISEEQRESLLAYCTKQTDHWMDQFNRASDAETKAKAAFNRQLFEKMTGEINQYHTMDLEQLPAA